VVLAGVQVGQRSLAAARLGGITAGAARAVERSVEHDDDLRRAWIGCDIICTLGLGMLRDGVVSAGFDSIDHLDFREWLRRHGASELTLRSGLVRALYDFVFAYVDGDPNRPSIGAGTILRVALRMLFGYSGAIFYRMQAGMGEVVFAPLYEVLRRRGVRFHFFSTVRRLELSPEKRAIARVIIEKQATLKNGSYEPLVDVDGLPCWPTTPLFDQLVEGRELAERRVDLESANGWSKRGEVTLERDRDFDDIVLGIPIGGLASVCSELVASRRDWAEMLGRLRTVRTQAAQLWMAPDLASLGWPHPSPISTGHAGPHSSWADFTHLIPSERWPAEGAPRSLAYLCGPLPEEASPDSVQNVLSTWLERHASDLWPRFSRDELIGGFGSQYVRANIAPSERYVLSLPNTVQYRLRADQSGFQNLFLAGDWVRTGLNLGCIESAVMAGLQAARGISSRPRVIFGESDLP
jgi:uncharacterized protein with NAD-binding domain and iron-sulfur cluster